MTPCSPGGKVLAMDNETKFLLKLGSVALFVALLAAIGSGLVR